MNPIPLLDLSRQYAALKTEIRDAVQSVLDHQHFILGDEVSQFEREAAEFLGCRRTVTCASGTDAIHLACRALGIGAGDEVITNAFSFIAGAEAIAYTGAVPVFADVTADTFALDPQAVADLITDKTKALLVVHLYGHPCDMDALNAICKQHCLHCIEDCAQAFGARYQNRYAGNLGKVGCHSFYPTKNLGAYGDGGMLSTNDDDLADQLILLRNHCDGGNYRHAGIGYNSRLDEIQAAILRVKLKYLSTENAKRHQIAEAYCQRLAGCVTTPITADGCEHVYHQYTIRSPRRDHIKQALAERGIGSRVYYPSPLPEQKAMQNCSRYGDYSVAQNLADTCLSIPIFPRLTDEEVQRVADAIIDAESK